MGWDSAPGIGMPCEAPPCASTGWGSAGPPRGEPANASASARTKRDQTLRPGSNGRSDQLQPQDRCPTTGAIKLRCAGRVPDGCRTNVKLQPPDWTGDEGIHQLRRSGPRCLRRARSNPQRQHSLVGDPSRERIIRQVIPGQQGSCPQISMAGNLGKAKQHGHCRRCRDRRRGLPAPLPQLPQSVHKSRYPPGYPRHRPRVRTCPAHARSIRLRSARRVSSRAFRRQPVCPFRSKPRSGNRAGGRVIP